MDSVVRRRHRLRCLVSMRTMAAEAKAAVAEWCLAAEAEEVADRPPKRTKMDKHCAKNKAALREPRDRERGLVR